MTKSVHFRILETWRLTAALLVMVWHYLRYAPARDEWVSDILYRLLPLMEMFFMISGFLIMMHYADTILTERGAWRRFLMRRIARLYPLYLATLAFFALVGLALHLGFGVNNWPGRYDLALLPANILLVQAWGVTDVLSFNYVGWTLSSEWFCYLLFPVIALVAARFGMRGLLAVIAIQIILLESATASGLMPFKSWLVADTWGAYRALADFTIGALVAQLVKASGGIRISHMTAWAVMGLAVAAMQTSQNGYLVLVLLAASIYAAAMAETANQNGSAWLSPLGPLGKVSFGIYLIHPVLETIAFSLIWKHVVTGTAFMPFYLYWLFPMVATLVLALLSDRYFEGPVARWLGRRGTPRPVPVGASTHA